MLGELESTSLTVAKYPVDGGYLRGVMSSNCEWYRELCSRYLSTRRRFPKLRTFIKRRCTIAALKRMIAGDLSGLYATRILDVIDHMGYPR